MRPIRAKISRLGGSSVIAIPLTLARMYEWAPGAIVRAKLVEGGAYFEKEVRDLYGGRSSGLIIPKDVLRAQGLAEGMEIDVPFYEWVTVRPVAWPQDGAPLGVVQARGYSKNAPGERREAGREEPDASGP